jgi:hypothetical protein
MVIDVRTLAAALVVAAVLLVPLGLMGTAGAATTDRDLTTVVIGPVSTDRFGGGDLVAVKAGDALFGVRYGTSEHPNDVVIFAEYKRFLGGAEIVDGQGNYLATRGIPVYTVLGQSLSHFIEFRPLNVSDGYDLTSLDRQLPPLTVNVPVKALSLVTAWQLRDLTNETVDGTTYVNFTVFASDLRYTRIADNTSLGDGMLNLVAFTFHLTVDIRERTAQIPWYRVTIDDGNRYGIERVEFLGYRNVTGPTIAMGAKYDHRIEGWDFAYPEDRLALVTQLIVGNFIPERTAEFIHEAFGKDRAVDENRTRLGDAATLNDSAPTRPHLYTRDSVYFDDEYTRIGRFTWVTDVTVDGVAMRMTFNLQGGGRILLRHGGGFFVGFWLRGAFVYPAGQVIVHDPVMSTEALLELPSGVNLTPLTILAAQLAVVGIAVGPALYLRAKARRKN